MTDHLSVLITKWSKSYIRWYYWYTLIVLSESVNGPHMFPPTLSSYDPENLGFTAGASKLTITFILFKCFHCCR